MAGVRRKKGARTAEAGRESSSHRRGRYGFGGVAILLCAAVSVAVAADHWANAGEVYGGVRVGEVEVGGKTPGEAREALGAHAAGLRGVRLDGPRDVSFSTEELGASYDIAATVERAYAVGRRGSVAERLSERVGAAVGGVRVAPVVDLEEKRLGERVEALAEKLDAAPREGAVVVRGARAEVVEARDGYRLDVAATAGNIERAVRRMSGEARLAGEVLRPEISTAEAREAAREARRAMSGGLTLVHGERRWTVPPAAVGASLDIAPRGGALRVSLDREAMLANLAEVRAALDVEPTEASYSLDGAGVSVIPGRAGRRVEVEELLDRISSGLFAGEREYRVPVAADEPDLTTAEAERLRPTAVLGEYKTDYTWDTDPGRRINMQRASDALNGTAVAPGETFSYNAITEPLDYEEAKVIENGRVEYAEGGGLSQVSSTLYMAANLAGLEIVEAHPHYAELPYIRPGFDTTVWFGALDLRFRNNTGGYILIEQWQGGDGYNHACIWGRPTGKEVAMRSEKVFSGEDTEGRLTTRWVVYKTVTRDGEVLYDGIFRRVTYKELAPYEPEQGGGG
ncbi:Uncharacterized vancomycin resistance protein-like protein [Rubrobacter xylanophilus DSM 9941]|uniref:Uncharacterized vancomycin resistance protein-like protein n=1 Tax=Rubrobacter xylanophilus (strain DSM 9941 / JCM 11954 / NBRC 16129 / PRD-1) TaxID=266117 RepID=Q1AUZ7_RUBXD|nr:peptidoglycan binding domain-containing protein [Rubrobacter xylanophilus]ABG04781.1 Uncharacterized vancomycin resistance protein-like protein [Rubrobacter xylanophilus DSM 9941]